MIITTEVLDHAGGHLRWPFYQDASFRSTEKLDRLRFAIRAAIEKELGVCPVTVTSSFAYNSPAKDTK